MTESVGEGGGEMRRLQDEASMTVVQRVEGAVMFFVMAIMVGMLARGVFVSGRASLRGVEISRSDSPQLFVLIWLGLAALALLMAWVGVRLAFGWAQS